MKVTVTGSVYDAEREPELATDQLSFCPFCGASAAELEHTWTACYSVKCGAAECGAEISGDAAHELKTKTGRRRFPLRLDLNRHPAAHKAAAYDAIRKWNHRAKVQP
ncbi:MAG: hypothetical protein E6Q97_20180 [Desulfurellales bacterium]|nr:MAG: hypothetical protein E6Q97_20180 [Desulfurellales bacterium]